MKTFGMSWSAHCAEAIGVGAIAVIGFVMAAARIEAAGEQRFASSDQAVSALVEAAKAHDTNAISSIFGPSSQELMSHDVVQATDESEMFLQRLSEKTEQVPKNDSKIMLRLGNDAWPFPIPLVKQGDKWFFDTESGKEEVLNRRIGRNELSAIRVCRAYVAAQREYASADRNGDEVVEYAQRLRSSQDAHDGLYWPVHGDEDLSPFGPLIAEARSEGYRHENKIMGDRLIPYHGYYFKILTKQGRHAPGGRYNYVINGHMVAGFALVAWPAEWGVGGVVTCIVNQQGKVYQKDLGPKTNSLAEKMKAYDPDDTWTAVLED